MGAIGYYYSKDGTDTNGPVPEDVLLQLFQQKVISTTSYLCREGESQWQPFNPAIFRDHTPLPPPQPPRSASKTRSKRKKGWITAEQIWDPRFRRMLNLITVIAVLVTAAIGIHVRYVVFADTQMSADSFLDVLEYFVGFALLAYTLPWVVAQFIRPSRRPLALTIGTVCAGPIIVAFLYYVLGGNTTIGNAQDSSPGDNTRAALGQARVAKGFTAGDLSRAEQVLQEAREAATIDKTDMSVVRTDLVSVIDTLATKCKACDDAAADCPRFDPSSISSLDDLQHRLDALGRLRDAQGDLNSYLQNIVANCRDALSRDEFGPATITEAIVGFRNSAQIDQLTTLTSLEMKVSDDQIACLKFLATTWGHWQVTNGTVTFEDNSTLVSYNLALQALQDDVTAQQDFQKQ